MSSQNIFNQGLQLAMGFMLLSSRAGLHENSPSKAAHTCECRCGSCAILCSHVMRLHLKMDSMVWNFVRLLTSVLVSAQLRPAAETWCALPNISFRKYRTCSRSSRSISLFTMCKASMKNCRPSSIFLFRKPCFRHRVICPLLWGWPKLGLPKPASAQLASCFQTR